MTAASYTKSPFFKPHELSEQTKYAYTQTPQGKHVKISKRQQPKGSTNAQGKDGGPKVPKEETKSSLIGCAANLINAIVGSGIVGLPFAIQQAGFCAGIVLVILCAVLTEKSLRLLIDTAKHSQVPTYERVAEAAFGRGGFLFVAINMFIMAYGAMLSYLMIVKDSFSSLFGIDVDNVPMRRAILFLISITIIVPLSSQRDMADLAKTSRMNVTIDMIMVCLVLYCAPIQESWQTFDWTASTIHYDTIFVGLGVLSFAFVCQHSAFIIAGSLDRPTQSRWSTVTKTALLTSATLALACGVGGYIGFQENTQGNILNSLDDSLPASMARGMLGFTMLFVYPMESFVARHVCVVLFFEGRNARDGDDSKVLSRRDRRITLTVLLYVAALIPAAWCENLGVVLAAAGTVGGSCLSYIGPGAIYLGVHGGRFLELSRRHFGRPYVIEESEKGSEMTPLYTQPSNGVGEGSDSEEDDDQPDSCTAWILKTILWYLLLMPLWCWVASVGKNCLTDHVHDLALKSPHPIRIGNIRYASARLKSGKTRVVMLQNSNSNKDAFVEAGSVDGLEHQHKGATLPTDTILLRADSIVKGYGTARTMDGRILALPANQTQNKLLPKEHSLNSSDKDAIKDYRSINQSIGAQLVKQKAVDKNEDSGADSDLEDDPQQIPPNVGDFAVAIFYILFGVLALVAGIISIVGADQ